MSVHASISDAATASKGLETKTIKTIKLRDKEFKLPHPIRVEDWSVHAIPTDNIIEALIRAWQVDAIKVNYYEALRDEDWSSSDI